MGVSDSRDDRAERNLGVVSVSLSTIISLVGKRQSTTEPHVRVLYHFLKLVNKYIVFDIR